MTNVLSLGYAVQVASLITPVVLVIGGIMAVQRIVDSIDLVNERIGGLRADVSKAESRLERLEAERFARKA